MHAIYLRFRNSLSDPWTDVPDITATFPSQLPGSLPVAAMRLQTAPENETPCGCPADSAIDDHYTMKAAVAPLPQSGTGVILQFLLRFKAASYHEAKYFQFASGDFISTGLSLVDCKNENGMGRISFRLDVPIADVL